jgi:predicted transcriptional regulator
MADAEQSNLTTLTVDLLSAYVTNNSVEHSDLSELIKSTHAALKVIESPEAPAPIESEHKPAVSIRKSLGSRTHIVSMIDGRSYQTLKRHLAKHGLTPKEYRERYKLPSDYPMVAPAYSESRRAIAQKLGLGRRVLGAQSKAVEAPAALKKAATPKALKKAKAAPTPSRQPWRSPPSLRGSHAPLASRNRQRSSPRPSRCRQKSPLRESARQRLPRTEPFYY